MSEYPLVIDTIGKLIDGGYELGAHCAERGCNHFGWLDLEMLAKRLGRDHRSMRADLVPHLRCSRCGSKNVSITLHPPTRSTYGGETAWMVPPARRS